MARLLALDQAKMNKRQKEIYNDIISGPRGNVRGPLAVWLYRAELADKAQQLGRYCRYESSLSPRLSELAILTTARIWGAAFEWQAHVPHELAAGIDQDVVDAMAKDHDPDFSNDDEQLVYEFSRELNLTRKVSDGLFERSISVLGEEGTVDLVGVWGYYALISMTIKAFDIDPITTR